MLLSAAMIVRNEAEHLDACLTSLDGIVDEIVVVDTGSTDDTVAVARRHGAVIDHVPWNDDFATPRNRSLELATGEWILYVDADERIRVPDPAALRAHLAATLDQQAYRVRFVPRVGWSPYFEFRLWRHDPGIRFFGAIHETMVQAIEAVARTHGRGIRKLDDDLPHALTIEHFGYEGDQKAKHARNEPMLRAALEQNPDRPFLYDHLARIYADLDQPEKARDTWRAGMAVARRRRLSHHDDKLLWINLLVHSVVHDDPDGDVAELLVEAEAMLPGNPAVEFATASHEFATGNPADAVARLERLVAMDMEAIVATESAYDLRIFGEWAWNALGLAHFALGDFAAAVDAFERAEQANPAEPAYKARRTLAEARRRA